jgi:hypothetical protein
VTCGVSGSSGHHDVGGVLARAEDLRVGDHAR